MINKFLSKASIYWLLTGVIATGAALFSNQQDAQALTFNFNFEEETSLEIEKGVKKAGRRWKRKLQDEVTINIDFQFGELPEGYLGGARPNMLRVTYEDAIQQLELDQISSDDHIAGANLPTYEDDNGNVSVHRWLNRTEDFLGLWHTDTSITNLWLTRANAKALGIVSGDDMTVDAVIRLNSQADWDFDATDGIGPGQYDFVGTMLHELGHTLGFLSGVDVLDFDAKQGLARSDEEYDFITSMDLFRQSDATKGQGKIDWTVDFGVEYFSINGGEDQIAEFANGAAAILESDNFQLSHFKQEEDSIMRPVLFSGTQSSISKLDLRLMDVIGWDRVAGSQIDYSNSSIAHTTENDSFDGALSWGGWSNTDYNYNFWQEGSFLASIAGATEHQDVPEPGMILGMGAIAILSIKSFKKSA